MRATAFLVVLSMVLLSTAALAGEVTTQTGRTDMSRLAFADTTLSKGTRADVPGLMSFTGTLVDTAGMAIDTTIAMTFSIYTDSLGGSQIWTETQLAVEVSNGLFNALLGRVNAIADTVFKDPERWLGLKVGDDPETEPRQRIGSVAYAFWAAEADTAEYARSGGGGGGDDADWTISGNDMYSAVSGNVGIGISSPASKLDVSGEINTNSFYKIGGSPVLSTTASQNTFVGIGAGENNTSSYGTFVGYNTGYNNEGQHNTFLGRWAGYSNTTGQRNTFIASNAGRENTSGSYNVFVGYEAGRLCSTGVNNVFLGYRAGYYESNSNKLYIDNTPTSSPLVYGEFDNDILAINGALGVGTTNPQYKLDVRGNRIQLKEDATGDWIALRTDGGGLDFQFQGATLYMQSLTSDEHILLNPSSGNNVAIGLTAPNRRLYIVENVDTLAYPLKIDNPHSNQANSVGVLFSVGGDGGHNLNRDRGKGALVYEYAGTWNRGKFHFLQDTGSNSNNPDLADAVMTIQNNGNVGIGTMSPAQKLDVDGTAQMTGFKMPTGASDDYVLTSNASGVGTWQAAVGGADGDWTISGNDMYSSVSGNVGIGTTSPDQKLHVAGYVKCEVLVITGGSDLAEPFDIQEQGAVKSGMVLTIDAENPGKLKISEKAYDRKVAGIISGAGSIEPGMLMGQPGQETDGEYPVALTGRVYCWADASNGSIQPGDLLTTSDAPGHAMRVTDYTRAQGAILGKAMSSLDEGKGLVLVLVTLQ